MRSVISTHTSVILTLKSEHVNMTYTQSVISTCTSVILTFNTHKIGFYTHSKIFTRRV
jgi:hypothetical protein